MTTAQKKIIPKTEPRVFEKVSAAEKYDWYGLHGNSREEKEEIREKKWGYCKKGYV